MLTVQEAAAALGVHPTAIYQAVKDGRLPSVTILGRRAIRPDDLAAYEPRTYRERQGAKPKGRPRKNAEGAA